MLAYLLRRDWVLGLIWHGAGVCISSSSLPVSVKELPKRQIRALYSEVQQENERQQSLTESGHKWNSLFLIVAFCAIFFFLIMAFCGGLSIK